MFVKQTLPLQADSICKVINEVKIFCFGDIYLYFTQDCQDCLYFTQICHVLWVGEMADSISCLKLH